MTLKVGDVVNVPFVVDEVNEHDPMHVRAAPLEPITEAPRGGYFVKARQAQVQGGDTPGPAPAPVQAAETPAVETQARTKRATPEKL